MNPNNPQLVSKIQLPIKRGLNEVLEEKTTEQYNVNYYNEYSRLYFANSVLSTQLKELYAQKNQLLSKLNRLDKRGTEIGDGSSGNYDDKKKRVRRSAVQIARHCKCPVLSCSKSYGSQGSLNQHIKLKHPDIYKQMGNSEIKRDSMSLSHYEEMESL